MRTAHKNTRRTVAVIFFLTLIFAVPALAAQPSVRTATEAESNPTADTATGKQATTKAAIKAAATSVSVSLQGTDTLGARLSFQLKELFNSGTIFALSDKDAPKLVVMLSTATEFPDRPGVGSVYSVVWLYSERSSVLSNYLTHETGIITPENVTDLATRLAERSTGLVAKHSYIFK